ncbi:MAG: radical SAM protein [Coriobacteriales bacterium]|jgi:pyruvate formate lyase activating enzyme
MHVSSLALDPIEKKPLARYKPGSMVLSVGSLGCTMHCPWCQNHEIAHPELGMERQCREMGADELAGLAERYVPQGNIGLAFTYNEPFYRIGDLLEVAQEVKARGLDVVVVTNGLIAADKLARVLPCIDALNIDLKGFTQEAYDVCGGKLETVKAAIAQASVAAHVEVTTLLIPGFNDDLDDLDAEARWLSGIDPDIPLHLTRFFPRWKWSDRPPTPIKTLRAAKEVCERHLNDVLLGNV